MAVQLVRGVHGALCAGGGGTVWVFLGTQRLQCALASLDLAPVELVVKGEDSRVDTLSVGVVRCVCAVA